MKRGLEGFKVLNFFHIKVSILFFLLAILCHSRSSSEEVKSQFLDSERSALESDIRDKTSICEKNLNTGIKNQPIYQASPWKSPLAVLMQDLAKNLREIESLVKTAHFSLSSLKDDDFQSFCEYLRNVEDLIYEMNERASEDLMPLKIQSIEDDVKREKAVNQYKKINLAYLKLLRLLSESFLKENYQESFNLILKMSSLATAAHKRY